MYKSRNAKSLIEKYIIMHPDKVIIYPLKKIANDLHYSEASIIKSIKLLGYKGLKDLKRKVFLKIKLERENSKQAKGLLIESLMATDQNINKTIDIEKIATIIKDKKIVIQGFNTLQGVALDFQKIFLKIGIDAFTCEFKEDLDLFENQVLFLLTTKGSRSITMNLIKYAKKKKMRIIAITTSDHNLSNQNLDAIISFIQFSHNEKDVEAKNLLIRYVLHLLIEMISNYKKLDTLKTKHTIS